MNTQGIKPPSTPESRPYNKHVRPTTASYDHSFFFFGCMNMLGAGRLRSAGAIGGEDAFCGGDANGGEEALEVDVVATFVLFVS